MPPKLLLILGPTGTGKSTVIKELSGMDQRFTYIGPYMTRELRPGETDKVPVSLDEFRRLEKAGKFVVVNELYGTLYGTPIDPILTAFRQQAFPVIDWPVQKIGKMQARFPQQVFGVYLEPASKDALTAQLRSAGREDRIAPAQEEFSRLKRGEFNGLYDHRVINRLNAVAEVAAEIYRIYLQEAVRGMQPGEQEGEDMKKMKNDVFRRVRGGKAVMLNIHCARCNALVVEYQKDGTGNLLRCYLNRIFAPPELARLQKDPSIRQPDDMKNLTCPSCENVVGTPMRHADGRLAFRLRQGQFYKKRNKD